jgi:hypothetical protein
LAPLALPSLLVGTGGGAGYATDNNMTGLGAGALTALGAALLTTKGGQRRAVNLLVGRGAKSIGMGQKLLDKRSVASALGAGSLGAALTGRQ